MYRGNFCKKVKQKPWPSHLNKTRIHSTQPIQVTNLHKDTRHILQITVDNRLWTFEIPNRNIPHGPDRRIQHQAKHVTDLQVTHVVCLLLVWFHYCGNDCVDGECDGWCTCELPDVPAYPCYLAVVHTVDDWLEKLVYQECEVYEYWTHSVWCQLYNNAQVLHES